MDTDFELFARLIETANRKHDGHLTVMKFTTNWRISFGTPIDHDDIADMPVGKTFGEAARELLEENHA